MGAIRANRVHKGKWGPWGAMGAMRPWSHPGAIGGHRGAMEAMVGHRVPSEAIGCHRKPSGAIGGHAWSTLLFSVWYCTTFLKHPQMEYLQKLNAIKKYRNTSDNVPTLKSGFFHFGLKRSTICLRWGMHLVGLFI